MGIGSSFSKSSKDQVPSSRKAPRTKFQHERRQLNEAAELFLRHQHKGLAWDPADQSAQAFGAVVRGQESGFVFSKEQIERRARKLMLQKPAFYAPHATPIAKRSAGRAD